MKYLYIRPRNERKNVNRGFILKIEYTIFILLLLLLKNSKLIIVILFDHRRGKVNINFNKSVLILNIFIIYIIIEHIISRFICIHYINNRLFLIKIISMLIF